MLEIEWKSEVGWGKPRIVPLQNLQIHPAAKCLHYASQLFEGMKAFVGVDGKIRLFRPDLNMRRMNATAARTGLPLFNGDEFIKCIQKLVNIERDWVPTAESSSLYIRPTFIGTDPSLGVNISNSALLYVILGPVGPYFSTGYNPVSLLADPKFVRAWPGGCGDKKMGSNYAPTVAVQKHAEKLKFQQVLWLFGDDHQLTEVGTMNIFVLLINKNGEKELVTPPLNGLILPGVTRQSVLDLARSWKSFKVTERDITMSEVVQAHQENRLLEIFGAGTACIVCPVKSIHYLGNDYEVPTMNHEKPLTLEFLKQIQNIQYGRVEHPWGIVID
ncbi:hypothetical protein CHUAL_001038 [Chamberlinius hualienensis]